MTRTSNASYGPMVRRLWFLIVLFVHVARAAVGGPVTSPDQVVEGFYATLGRPTAGFSEDLDRLDPFLSAGLIALVAKARDASDRYLRIFPTDIPPFEHGSCVFLGVGDCEFSRYKILQTKSADAASSVEVQFGLRDRYRPNNPHYLWRNVVLLRFEGGRWVISDVKTPQGSASKALNAVIRDSGINGRGVAPRSK